jgi:hypothetical protein
MGLRAFLFFLPFWGCLPAFAASDHFCVQTFNVYAPAYASGVDFRLTQLADSMLRDPCDSFQFQELWRQSQYESFAGKTQPARLAMVRADEMRGDDAMTGLASGYSGQVLWGKAELFGVNNKDGFLDWVRNLTGVQKGYTLLKVKLGHSPPTLFVNLHDHPTDPLIRLAQVTQLIGAVLAVPDGADLPLVLTGDLNATPDSLELQLLRNVLLLRDSFAEAHAGYGSTCTYCSDNPLSWGGGDRVIDYVLFRSAPAYALNVEQSEIDLRGEPYQPLSDHYGVRSELRWSERSDAPLDWQSETVRSRIAQAVQTLHAAKAALRERSGAGFRQAAQALKALQASLETGDVAPALKRIFETP